MQEVRTKGNQISTLVSIISSQVNQIIYEQSKPSSSRELLAQLEQLNSVRLAYHQQILESKPVDAQALRTLRTQIENKLREILENDYGRDDLSSYILDLDSLEKTENELLFPEIGNRQVNEESEAIKEAKRLRGLVEDQGKEMENIVQSFIDDPSFTETNLKRTLEEKKEYILRLLEQIYNLVPDKTAGRPSNENLRTSFEKELETAITKAIAERNSKLGTGDRRMKIMELARKIDVGKIEAQVIALLRSLEETELSSFMNQSSEGASDENESKTEESKTEESKTEESKTADLRRLQEERKKFEKTGDLQGYHKQLLALADKYHLLINGLNRRDPVTGVSDFLNDKTLLARLFERDYTEYAYQELQYELSDSSERKINFSGPKSSSLVKDMQIMEKLSDSFDLKPAVVLTFKKNQQPVTMTFVYDNSEFRYRDSKKDFLASPFMYLQAQQQRFPNQLSDLTIALGLANPDTFDVITSEFLRDTYPENEVPNQEYENKHLRTRLASWLLAYPGWRFFAELTSSSQTQLTEKMNQITRLQETVKPKKIW